MGRRLADRCGTAALGVAVLAVLVCAGCGSEPGGGAGAAAPQGGDEPTTPRVLAAVAAEHLGAPDSARAESDAAEELGRDGVGTELRYGSDGEYDGHSLVVAVGPDLDPELDGCVPDPDRLVDGCVETDGGVLLWEEQEPEEDPGVVYVVVGKDEGATLLFYTGPAIAGDPRDLDLPVPVEDLFAIAHDPRVDVTTSADAVAAGRDLPFWRGR